MKKLKEGIRIPVTETDISVSGHDDKDNPICHAITAYLEKENDTERFSTYFCLIDENITVYRKGIAGKLATLYTSRLLEDWLRAYYDHRDVLPFTLKIYQQRDDNGEIEDERLWIGIAEDGDGVSESCLEKLYGLLSVSHIEIARNNAFVAGVSGVNLDDTCPVTNVLTEMVEHISPSLEVGVDSEQAEFYVDESQTSIVIPLTLDLNAWICRYARGEEVKEGVIYINRDDTLPNEPLFVGIDYDLAGYNLLDFDRLHGMERRLTRKHIDESQRGNCEQCAVANVLSEMFVNYEVNVNGDEAVIHTNGNEHAVLLISDRLSDWIDAYDNENSVSTFSLVIKNLEGNEYHRYELDIKDLTERQKDLQNRISRLSELSSEMELFIQKLTDRDQKDFDKLMQEYEDLFAETVHKFGN